MKQAILKGLTFKTIMIGDFHVTYKKQIDINT